MIDLAASAGLVLDGWQQAELRNGLGERADGSWAASEVGIVVPRQNGKGEILLARELGGLFLFEERMLLHSAHEFRTAQDAYRRLVELIESAPHLDALVKRKLNNTTETSIELFSGQRVRFVSRTKGAGRGLSGDVVILDEAYKLPSEAMAALIPTMAARPNRQLWYTSSAPLPEVESDTLRRLCRRGRAGVVGRLAYSEYCVPALSATEVDLQDRDLWRQANPGMGNPTEHSIEEEAIETELDSLAPEDFARERLGVVDLSDQSIGRVIPPEAWAACKDPKSGPIGAVAFALDVAPDRRTGAFGVVGESGKGGTHGEIADYGTGTNWMVNRAKELQSKWGGRLAVGAASPAASLIPELEAAGVDVLMVSTGDHAAACGALFDAISQHQFRHLGQPELDAAVVGADRRFYGDAWLWSRRTSTSDISPLVAVTLAKWAFDQGPAKPTLSVW